MKDFKQNVFSIINQFVQGKIEDYPHSNIALTNNIMWGNL